MEKQSIIDAAKIIGCKPEVIVAVARKESSSNGFLSTGEPAILFEPHIFWKQLRKRGIDPNVFAKNPRYSDILYPVWGSKPYGKSSKQHARLQLASEIDREAALQSASWGKFQIMGFNYRACGCITLQDFVNKIYKSEEDHLILFVNYIKASRLDDELREEDFDGFAAGYNGPQWRKNNYGEDMRTFFKEALLSFNK